jgi:hypothetical protein
LPGFSLDTRRSALNTFFGCGGKPARAPEHEQNRMTKPFQEYREQLLEFIRERSTDAASDLSRLSAAENESRFNRLALTLFSLQFDHVEPYRRFCQARGVGPDTVSHWTQIPAIATDAFKETALTSLSPEQHTRVFHSSGTTGQKPSRHFHNAESLAIYEASLLPWFARHLLSGAKSKLRFVILTPSSAQAPHSSVVHMFETVRREFGSADSVFTGQTDSSGAWFLDRDTTLTALHEASEANQPIVVLGTAFSFVHLLGHFIERGERLRLPGGSRVMETGGYKGRSRSLPKDELHSLIVERLGISATHIVCEYGMSELSSQAYDHIAGHDASTTQRALNFPPWARARIVSPETGLEVADGKTGLIRVFDLANVHSVMAIQTADLGIRRREGFELVGRATHAEPRGCSLMAM